MPKFKKGDLLRSQYGSRLRVIRILNVTTSHKAYLIKILVDSLVPKNVNKSYPIPYEVLDKATGVTLADNVLRLLYD